MAEVRDRSGRIRTGEEELELAKRGDGGEPEGGRVGGRKRKSSVGAVEGRKRGQLGESIHPEQGHTLTSIELPH